MAQRAGDMGHVCRCSPATLVLYRLDLRRFQVLAERPEGPISDGRFGLDRASLKRLRRAASEMAHRGPSPV